MVVELLLRVLSGAKSALTRQFPGRFGINHARPHSVAAWRLSLALASGWLLAASISGGHAQGLTTFDPTAMVVLRTGGDRALVSSFFSLSWDSSGAMVDPILSFQMGFATDEALQPGVISDSFSVSLQGAREDGGQFAFFLTADASGFVWAPETPLAVGVDPMDIVRQEQPFPNLSPELAWRQSYSVLAPVPTELGRGPFTVYFDLFDNQNSVESLGWHSEVQVIPEPAGLMVWGAVILGGVFGLVRAGERRRRSRVSSVVGEA